MTIKKLLFIFLFAALAGCEDTNVDNEGSPSQDPTPPGGGGGGATALLVISDGATYDYGSVTVSTTSTHTFTVVNVGSATATALSGSGLAAPYSFNGGIYPGTGGTCGVTLPAAATCTITVTFSPVGMGVSADTINLDYNDGSSAQTASRPITGTGS